MPVRKRCNEDGCERNDHRCDHPWWFDVMHERKRFRMRVDDFAIPRMPEGERRPVRERSEAERRWEPLFIGEIVAGRDPRSGPQSGKPKAAGQLTVSQFLDDYLERRVLPQRLKSLASMKSRLKILKEHLGELPVSALERPEEINRFKTASSYAEDNELASVHRALEVLRTAINWGRAQSPPLLTQSPFHRFGVTMNKKEERERDRRVHCPEEQTLLATALSRMNTAEHQFVGPLLHDRIVGALELCCRRGEMLMIQNRRVDWETCQIGIPGATAKDKENRRLPFDPDGRLAKILQRRGTLGPNAFVFGSASGEYQPNIQTAWETLKLLANGLVPRRDAEGVAWNQERLREIDLRWHDLRHEGACRLLADGVDVRNIQLMLGHATLTQTQRYLNVTDEELRKGLEASWKMKKRRLRMVKKAS